MPVLDKPSLLALALAVAATACANSPVDPGGGGGGEGGGTTNQPQHADLFACGAPLDCEQMREHIEPEPWSALNCAAKLVLANEASVLSALYVPGPTFYQTESLILLRGDGTALVQTRHRECGWDEVCTQPVPWEPSSVHQICDVGHADELAAACAAEDDLSCAWSPWHTDALTNCHDVEDWTCAEVSAALE